MRRFLIWSGLAAVIGVAIAVVGVWAYNHFYVRFQPVTIDRNQAEIQRLLDQASWVSAGGGDQPVYVIGYRDSPPTLAYLQEEAAKLHVSGSDVRVLMFARPDREGAAQSTAAERATIAELWLNRDWSLYQRWVSTPVNAWTADGLAPADGNLARSAVVEASRQFTVRLGVLLKTAGVRSDWPLVIWRDREGFLKACACSDRRSWAFVRDDLGAPDAVGDAGGGIGMIEAQPAPADPTPPDGAPSTSQGLPYPNLSPVPPSPADPSPANPAPGAGGSSAVSASPGAPVTSNRLERPTPRAGQARPASRPPAQPTTPKPPQEEDTRFY